MTAGAWEDLTNRPWGIGGCSPTCTQPAESNHYSDACGNQIYITCRSNCIEAGACGYEFWFNSTRIGACVYPGGLNEIAVRWNAQGCLFMRTAHLTRDPVPTPGGHGFSGCSGLVYTWQLYYWGTEGPGGAGYCRCGSDWDLLDPSVGTNTYPYCYRLWWEGLPNCPP
jgi:hypothetical protein